ATCRPSRHHPHQGSVIRRPNRPDDSNRAPRTSGRGLRVDCLQPQGCNMFSNICKGLFVVALSGVTSSAFANVITDWDEHAVSITRQMSPYASQGVMGRVHAAMFDAVNSIERRFRPYRAQLPAAPATSKEAAAAAAAAAILVATNPKTANNTKALLASYL